MKTKTLILSLSLLITITLYSQTNQEIANIYFDNAEKAMEKIDYNGALIEYQKGIEIIGEPNNANIAQQGIFIHYELKNYDKVKELFNIYFQKQTNTSSENHKEMIELYSGLQAKITEQAAEQAAKEKAIAQQKIKEAEQKALEAKKKLEEQKRLAKRDSLTKIWNKNAERFSLKVDELFPFNKNGVAVYKKNLRVGLIDDQGKKLIKAAEFETYLENGKFIILLDKIRKPEVVYYFNSQTKKGEYLSEPFEYSSNSEFFEKVMTPNGNILVLYPNNSTKTITFDLSEGIVKETTDLKDLFKKLKKADKIDKYEEDERKVRIDKNWYYFGEHLGNGVMTLYDEGKKINGFLFTNTGDEEKDRILYTREQFHYLGYFQGNKAEATRGRKRFWIDGLGNKTEKKKARPYLGEVKIIKESDGVYKLQKEGRYILNGKSLDNLDEYLKKNK